MSNKKILEEYLLTTTKKTPFLLDKNNNGKTIMLSGAWGAGKTHFWQKEIEPNLSKELKKKDKACVYISLYGKDSLESLKKEIYLNAFSENKLISKEVSAFGFDALSSIKDSDLVVGKALKAFSDLNSYRKKNKGANRLKEGGIICLDDFERKSKKIDLNDLFGFISQLALDMECKIIIILNSDVFTGKEAEVFRNVKEKTINKFFYYEPTIEELFESISSDEKYDDLNDYKEDILKAIKETEELNARIYMQVLDNCLEWLEVKVELDKNIIRVLVLGTFNFVLNHMVLDYQKIQLYNSETSDFIGSVSEFSLKYKNIKFYSNKLFEDNLFIDNSTISNYINKISKLGKEDDFIKKLKLTVTSSIVGNGKFYFSETSQEEHLKWIDKSESKLKALWKYGYRLYYVADVEEEVYNEISQFIKTGILI